MTDKTKPTLDTSSPDATVHDHPAEHVQHSGSEKKRRRTVFDALGPGLITGASDDDPSGIATYSQVGAQFGYGMLWTMLFSYPLMAVIQAICGRIGRVTGHGIAGNLRRYYPNWLACLMVSLMVIANTINIGADIGAMGEALKLLIGGPALLYAAMFALISLLLQMFVRYTHYVRFLKWLTVALFSYVAVVFSVHVPWGAALRDTFVPHISFKTDYLTAFIAVLGTTISPYLFFWQASEEAEDVTAMPGEKPLKRAPEQAPTQLRRIKMDTAVGMAFSNLVAFFIMLTCAVTLHAHNVTNIDTAAQAAEALRPIAGKFTFLLFGMGIIGTGLLAVPVLAGSAAYAVGEIFRWPVSLEKTPWNAKGFYGVLAAATLIGLALNFTSINPIKALFWTAVINGVVAVPLMVMIMLLGNNPNAMGDFTLSSRSKVIGWAATLVMLAAAIGMFATWGK